jgi:hypothetical protein
VLVEKSGLPLSVEQQHAIDALKTLPAYLEQGRLDIWDEKFPKAILDDQSNASRLIAAAYFVGEANLYGGFDPAFVLKKYRSAASVFRELGLSPPGVRYISDW